MDPTPIARSLTLGQELVKQSIHTVTATWVDAGDSLTDFANGEDVNLEAALDDAYQGLGHAIEELQGLISSIDHLAGEGDPALARAISDLEGSIRKLKGVSDG